jgi:ribokinase
MREHASKPRLVVVGAAVMDLVFPVRALPRWREAVQAHSFTMYPGGKGLNQAIAAARLGAAVSLVSAVGDDEFGERILQYADLHRVSREFIRVVDGARTDVTGVFVNDQGEAAFVGWKGMTTTKVDRDHLQSAQASIAGSDAVLITFEVSLDAVREAIDARVGSAPLLVVNPSPPLDPLEPPPYALMQRVDVLVANNWEACQLLRMEHDNLSEFAQHLQQHGGTIACVVYSEEGYAIATRDSAAQYPAVLGSRPVDTTGGSDAFCATLAIALIKGIQLEDAAILASAAEALAVLKRGGAPSMPTADELNGLCNRRRLGLQIDT